MEPAIKIFNHLPKNQTCSKKLSHLFRNQTRLKIFESLFKESNPAQKNHLAKNQTHTQNFALKIEKIQSPC